MRKRMSQIREVKVPLSNMQTSGSNFISWNRLEGQFLNNGELRPNERLTEVKITAQGITYSVANVNQTDYT